MINTQFLVTIYFVSLFIDWIFQTDWQATNKSKWGENDNLKQSWWANLSHCLIYSGLTVLGTIVLMGGTSFVPSTPWPLIQFILCVSHFIIDTRIPVKWIMRMKGMSKAQIEDYQNYGFMHIGIDHRLHEAVLVILSAFV